MIEPIIGLRGQEQALCTCDECAAQVVYAAPHDKGLILRGRGKRGQPTKPVTLARPSAVIDNLRRELWQADKGKLRCPKCVRKAITPEEETKLETANDLRQPTPDQIREIFAMLMTVYDIEKKRYRGNETDKTVAETLEGGILPGWVARVRDDFKFGPAGGNEEMDQLLDDLNVWQASVDTKVSQMRADILASVEQERAKFEKRMEVLKKAVGPKAAGA